MTSGTWIATAASGCLKIMMFGSGPKLLLGYEGWCGAWHGMLLDCVTLPVLSGSVLSMHLAWSSRVDRKIAHMRGIGNNGVLLLSRADSRKWQVVDYKHCCVTCVIATFDRQSLRSSCCSHIGAVVILWWFISCVARRCVVLCCGKCGGLKEYNLMTVIWSSWISVG